MNTYGAAKLLPLVKAHGRTRYIAGRDALFFNWTCSGFTVTFTGTVLRAKILALGDRTPFPPDSPADLPVIALVGEDGETLSARFPLAEGENELELFSGRDGEHTVRLVKLSENMRGKAALLSLETDGSILPAKYTEKKLKIEFVGDSITCGFGNEAPGRDSLFNTGEENGWFTFGAVAARELNAEFNMISVSGIATGAPKYPLFPGKNMEDVYEFTDVYCDERLGSAPERWDFSDKKDIVIINLGTNDSARIWSYQELSRADEEAEQFSARYKAFLEMIRRNNGPDAFLVCTLGPLDYFLYDRIEKAVADYRSGTGDERITAFKLIGVNLMTEGFGAVSHPSAKTQLRMGKELAARLRGIKQLSI